MTVKRMLKHICISCLCTCVPTCVHMCAQVYIWTCLNAMLFCFLLQAAFSEYCSNVFILLTSVVPCNLNLFFNLFRPGCLYIYIFPKSPIIWQPLTLGLSIHLGVWLSHAPPPPPCVFPYLNVLLEAWNQQSLSWKSPGWMGDDLGTLCGSLHLLSSAGKGALKKICSLKKKKKTTNWFWCFPIRILRQRRVCPPK